MTMMVVTHEMPFARNVGSRLAFMDRGEIVEEAAPEQFFFSPAQRARPTLPAAVRGLANGDGHAYLQDAAGRDARPRPLRRAHAGLSR
jgi:ABC-type methionine transport system ATPase subunit